MYNYFTYCKIVSFLLFTVLTRFTHRFKYCVQCHIGCDNKLTVYIRLVSQFIFGPLVETVPLVILNARGIIVVLEKDTLFQDKLKISKINHANLLIFVYFGNFYEGLL